MRTSGIRVMSTIASSVASNKPKSVPSYAIGFENAVEQREAVALRVQGQIPSWLRGKLYRTGPGTFRVDTSASPKGSVDLTHWFDGLGMTHCFNITADAGVMYSNRSTATGLQKRIEQAGSVPGITFGDQDPCKTIFAKFFTLFKPHPLTPLKPIDGAPDDVNISVTLTPDMPGFSSHASTKSLSSTSPRYIVAKSDNDTLQILDPETLAPLHATTYAELDPRLDGQISAAHSCRDKVTDEFFNFSLKMAGRPVYKVFRVRPNETSEKGYEVDILAEINDAPAAYLHSFVMTEKYVVLCVWQADFKYFGATIPLNRNIASSLEKKWNPKRDALFYVIDRQSGGVVSKFQTPPFFCFHAINAFDSGSNDITIDLSVYENHSVIDLLYLDNLRNLTVENPMLMGRATRFVLKDVAATGNQSGTRKAEIQWTAPQSSSIELPTIHPALYHKPYRFAYGMNKLDPKTHQTFADRIIKLDTANPNTEPKAWGAQGYTPGEPIFVPRPTSASGESNTEDDGVLLSVVLDGETQKSMLIILDAKEMKEVARAEMDTHFPFVFHGVFTPSA